MYLPICTEVGLQTTHLPKLIIMDNTISLALETLNSPIILAVFKRFINLLLY